MTHAARLIAGALLLGPVLAVCLAACAATAVLLPLLLLLHLVSGRRA